MGIIGDIVDTLSRQVLRNKVISDAIFIVNGVETPIGGGGGVSTTYPILDISNGLTYKLISDGGVLGLEEIGSPYSDNLITDLSDGKTYKVISDSGVLGLEEI